MSHNSLIESIYFLHSLDDYIHTLEKEINIDFSRAMNRITFDSIVAAKPEMFAFVTVPDPVEEVVPERGEKQ